MEHELELVFSKDPWKLSGGWGPRLSGLTVTFVARAPAGRRIRSLRVAGSEVDDDTRYSVTGCERDGEADDVLCRMRGVHDAKELPVTIHEALDRYLERRRVVAPSIEQRAVALDLPDRVPSQDAVLAGIRR
jgi:hypothetical protein